MELSGKDNFEQENGNDNLMSYQLASVPSGWRFGGSSTFTNTPTASVPTGNHLEACKAGLTESSSCSSGPMLESFCPAVWDHPTNSQNLGFCETSLQNSGSTSNTLGIRKGPLGPFGTERTVDMGWTPPNSIAKPAMFLPTASGIIPLGLSQFPADSGFIERAARFSCFSAGTFGDMMNPFGISEPVNPYVRAAAIVQQPEEMFSGSVTKSVSVGQSQKNEVNMAEASKNVFLSVEQGTAEGSPPKNERKTEGCAHSHDEVKQDVAASGNDSDEAEFSGIAGQEEPSILGVDTDEPSSSKGLGSKKRRRSGQDNQHDQVKEEVQPPGETAKANTEIQQKGDPGPTLTPNKSSNKHSKQGSQASDSPKEEYIHVRARRGQATNSHSLAERIRREKISERMKFLQDLVPGCSKVTGKAVMLDEIINYVQSLQRQVEFLSMKLATVNPRLDFNLEGVLAKDILQSRAGPLSMLSYSPDLTVPFPPLHPPQPGLTQTVLPAMANPSDTLHRSVNTELAAMNRGYKEPSQVPNIWGEDELHNVVQMGFNSSAALDNQDLNGSLPPSHMKAEL